MNVTWAPTLLLGIVVIEVTGLDVIEDPGRVPPSMMVMVDPEDEDDAKVGGTGVPIKVEVGTEPVEVGSDVGNEVGSREQGRAPLGQSVTVMVLVV